jgi:hypothetical protein
MSRRSMSYFRAKAWMAGTSPAMTAEIDANDSANALNRLRLELFAGGDRMRHGLMQRLGVELAL